MIFGLRLSATPSDHAFRPCLPTCDSGRGRYVHSKTTEETSQSYFRSSLRPLRLRSGVHATSLCVCKSFDTLRQGPSHFKNRAKPSTLFAFCLDGPLFRQTDDCDTSRPKSSIRQARLRSTPFSHAFRPRFPATPKPRVSATFFSHAFRPCLPTCHSDRGR